MDNYVTGMPKERSYNFLYPLTGFKKNYDHKPAGTYLYWKEENIENYKLIIHYDNIIKNFSNFESKVILKREKIENCYSVKNGMVYIYDLAYWARDIYEFLQGKYSRFSKEAKERIMAYHSIEDNKEVEPGRFVYMALFPELFYAACAEELGVSEDVLRGNELLEIYDKDFETLKLDIITDCACVDPKILTL